MKKLWGELRYFSDPFSVHSQPIARSVKHGLGVCLHLTWRLLITWSVKHDGGSTWWVQVSFLSLPLSAWVPKNSKEISSEVLRQEIRPQVAWIESRGRVDSFQMLPTTMQPNMRQKRTESTFCFSEGKGAGVGLFAILQYSVSRIWQLFLECDTCCHTKLLATNAVWLERNIPVACWTDGRAMLKNSEKARNAFSKLWARAENRKHQQSRLNLQETFVSHLNVFEGLREQSISPLSFSMHFYEPDLIMNTKSVGSELYCNSL